ncbi:MAG: MBL fold metallo-hydrolase [Candidatus Eisenbacteria bacterium]|uniref:MBL fold metallo-hydrolase n=1 Tax=Eiseniibacteriota bacterium TaxID=2212470 RepID=A0A948RTV9_UNCEI|nr:MBL fold metallo-hydrolase [Candidatus Eisenbacteria bacterium]MBU1949141.1 MBL fold metallo-hydrolase [Candidatus Eisenbacteria bacterium]MBU2690795.1 MBL fold metallo-hydrolase [Candidatus Eisenbacteria bacterium]
MKDNLIGYSKALYASWFYYRPARLLLDSGEGVIHHLKKRIFGIQKIFITHGHEDHIAGLPSMVNLRNLSNGPREAPLAIYYPKGDPWIAYLIDYLDKKQKDQLRYKLSWFPIEAGAEIPLEFTRRQVRVSAFKVEHAPDRTCLGYRIEEQRRRLRAAHDGLEPMEIKRLIADIGREKVLEDFWHPLLVYTGDTMPLPDTHDCVGAEILMIDSTFLDRIGMEGSGHSCIEANMELAVQANVKHLILTHLSGRYKETELLASINDSVKRFGRPPRLGYFFEEQYIELPALEG